jgi:hypothetical protein
MPRYFFHSRGPAIGQYYPDQCGQQLADLQAARLIAEQTAAELVRTEPGKEWRGWLFDIVSEDGVTLIQPFVASKS